MFSYFFTMAKIDFLGQRGGHGPMAPLNTPLHVFVTYKINKALYLLTN